MISLFGNYGEQESQQSSSSQSASNSGFQQGGQHGKGWASELAVRGLGRTYNRNMERLEGQPLPQFQFSQTMPGLFQEQEGWANAFANQLFNKTSSSAAARGQMSPFNLPAVVGSALTKAAPQILPMIAQNLQTAALMPEQIFAQRTQNVMSPLQALVAGLGSGSSSSSVGSGFSKGMNVGGGGSYGGSGGGGGGIG
jgi:hypothetical protein